MGASVLTEWRRFRQLIGSAGPNSEAAQMFVMIGRSRHDGIDLGQSATWFTSNTCQPSVGLKFIR